MIKELFGFCILVVTLCAVSIFGMHDPLPSIDGGVPLSMYWDQLNAPLDVEKIDDSLGKLYKWIKDQMRCHPSVLNLTPPEIVAQYYVFQARCLARDGRRVAKEKLLEDAGKSMKELLQVLKQAVDKR